MAWPLGMGSVLLVLASSETLGIKPGLGVFGVSIRIFGCVVRDWFDGTLKGF